MQNHDQSLKNAKEVEDHLRTKYTREELYEWFVTQIKGIYFQGYKVAYDLAKRAQKTFQFELAQPETTFLSAAYWDTTKDGLLAGERLLHDLRRMEAAYLEQNKREYEITKHVSLAEVDPEALIKLRETGECTVILAESLFDLDWPGHYLRRIKSVSVTVPVTNAPYGSVNCALSITENSVRKDDQESNGADRFRKDYTRTESIVTSTAQNDSGTFELVFRDERYLPFEGAGVRSTWSFELKPDGNRFDTTTIHDVVMHLRYMARKGSSAFATFVSSGLNTIDGPVGQRLFSARTDFPDAWELFKTPAVGASETILSLPLALRHFLPMLGVPNLRMKKLRVFIKRSNGNAQAMSVEVRVPNEALGVSLSTNVDLDAIPADFGKVVYGDLTMAEQQIRSESEPNFAPWKVRMSVSNAEIDDLWFVCEYRRVKP